MQAIGLDIGGAHLKLAGLSGPDTVDWVFQLPCPLWKGLDQLADAWRKACANITIHAGSQCAVTMTGELADCFTSRNDGVWQITDCLKGLLEKPFWVYAGDRGLLDPEAARSLPELVASANWHASACCVAEYYSAGLFIDIGTTTTDIIPFNDGVPQHHAYDDHRRMACRELIYSGVVRTPVMALLQSVQLDGRAAPLVAEHFATMADVYRLTGDLPPYCDQYPSSDLAPATRTASARRLARMVAMDFNDDEEFWV